MRNILKLGFGAALAVAVSAAHAADTALQFLNIDISGSLARGATARTSGNMVDFSFPNAIVGDG
ncbi:MAG TPA: hypothetical protein VEX38_09725 [Fimbriimonadaceae bacterium]|nr:hypothetical protein [Fimbriimonadaceae bacterium]